MTSTRAARAAGSAEATTAAANSTNAEATTGSVLGICMPSKYLFARRANAYPNDGAGNNADRGHNRALGDDARQETARLRPNRQPDAKLPRPRTNRKGQHASDANDSNRQRHDGKASEDDGVQSVRREHFRANIRERSGVLDRLVRRHVMDHACDRRHQSIRICAGAHKHLAAKH